MSSIEQSRLANIALLKGLSDEELRNLEKLAGALDDALEENFSR